MANEPLIITPPEKLSKAQVVKGKARQVATTRKAQVGYTVVGTVVVQQALNKVYPGCGDALADVISSMSSFVIPGL